jgi:hypothetical protein
LGGLRLSDQSDRVFILGVETSTCKMFFVLFLLVLAHPAAAFGAADRLDLKKSPSIFTFCLLLSLLLMSSQTFLSAYNKF